LKIPGFLSYAHEDGSELTESLANYLKNLFQNFEPVYDKDVPEGDKLEKINEKLNLCNLVIVVITPGALVSKPVENEIKIAKEKKMKIIPCKDKYTGKSWSNLPWDLSEYKGIDFENVGELKRKTYAALVKILEELSAEFQKSLPQKTKAEKIEKPEIKDDVAKQSIYTFNIDTAKGYHVITGMFIQDGKIQDLLIDRKSLSLIVKIDVETDDQLSLVFKSRLLDSKTSDGRENDFFVLVDGVEVDHEYARNFDDAVHITVNVPASAKEVEIIGTEIEGISYQGEAKKENEVKILQGSAVPHDGQHLDPETLTIKIGDTVKWINDDSAVHTVTNGTPGDDPGGNFDSGMLMPKATFSVTFNEAGTYPYFDMVHPWIIGTIVVEEK